MRKRVVGLCLAVLLCGGSALANRRAIETQLPACVSEANLPPPSGEHGPEVCGDQTFAFGKNIDGKAHGTTYVSFTFDDGPRIDTTPSILATLARYDIVATFFVVGQRFTGDSATTQKAAEILRQEITQGHSVGNHTFRHKNIKKQSAEAMETSIEDTRDAIIRVLGYHSYLFRAPYGARTKHAHEYLAEHGYTHVLWDIDSRDYRSRNWQTLRKRVTKAILSHQGGVILLHDIKPVTVQALPYILDDLEAENCKRLDTDEPLILPVSLHYMARDKDGTPRTVPAAAREHAERYQAALPERCEKRKNAGNAHITAAHDDPAQ